MNVLPALPPSDGLHPLVVHLPIGLLMAAPLLVLIAMFMHKQRLAWSSSALLVIALGTIGTWVAVSTGEATEDYAERIAAAEATLERHEELAETTRLIFTGLTLAFAGAVAAVIVRGDKLKRGVWMGACAVFLGLYGVGFVYLANTGHEGGRLVHEFGVHAPVSKAAASTPGALDRAGGERREHDDDD